VRAGPRTSSPPVSRRAFRTARPSDNWIRDKAESKEISIEHKAEKKEMSVERSERSPSREIGAKRTFSRAPSVEVERSEKKAKAEEDAEPVAAIVEYYVSPDPSELPIPKFLKTSKTAVEN